MTRAENTAGFQESKQRLLWIAIFLVGAVYFYVAHDLQVSRYERFAPWSDADGTLEAAGGNMAKGLALSCIGAFGLYLLLRRDARPLRLHPWIPWLMFAYLAWSATSVLWSSDPGLSLRRLAVLLACAAAALGFARHFTLRDIAVMALSIGAAYLAAGIAVEVALGTFRPWAADYRFAGTVHPNTQGAHLTMFCLAAFCLARSENRHGSWLWAVFALGIVFLALTKSRTSCAAVFVSLAALWLVNASHRRRLRTLAASGFVLCVAALVAVAFDHDFDKRLANIAMLGRAEGSEALTGRIPLWNNLLGHVAESPLLGHGYEAFWTLDRIEDVSADMEWPLREAHNAYVDALLSVGFLGAAVMLTIVIWGLCASVAAYRQNGCPGCAFLLCMIVFGLLNACLESGMGSPNLITLIAGAGIVLLAMPSHADTLRGTGLFSHAPPDVIYLSLNNSTC